MCSVKRCLFCCKLAVAGGGFSVQCAGSGGLQRLGVCASEPDDFMMRHDVAVLVPSPHNRHRDVLPTPSSGSALPDGVPPAHGLVAPLTSSGVPRSRCSSGSIRFCQQHLCRLGEVNTQEAVAVRVSTCLVCGSGLCQREFWGLPEAASSSPRLLRAPEVSLCGVEGGAKGEDHRVNAPSRLGARRRRVCIYIVLFGCVEQALVVPLLLGLHRLCETQYESSLMILWQPPVSLIQPLTRLGACGDVFVVE